MLFLKEMNIEDAKKEYIAITSIPEYENGFENKFYNVSFEDFVNEVIPTCEKQSKGIDLKPNRVAQNYYFIFYFFLFKITSIKFFKIFFCIYFGNFSIN